MTPKIMIDIQGGRVAPALSGPSALEARARSCYVSAVLPARNETQPVRALPPRWPAFIVRGSTSRLWPSLVTQSYPLVSMRRRELIALIGCAAPWPLARVQPAARGTSDRRDGVA